MRESKTHRARFLIAAGLLLLLAAPVLAQPHHRGPHGRFPMSGEGLHWIADELELSQGQRDQIREIFTSGHESLRGELERLREAQEALAEQIHSEIFDEAAIRMAAVRVAEVEADLAVGRARTAMAVKEILTPEQQEKAELLRELRQSRREHRGERMRHPGFRD